MTNIMKTTGFLFVAAVLLWAAVPFLRQSTIALEEAAAAIQANTATVSLIRLPPSVGTKYSDAVAHHGAAMADRVRRCLDKGGADFVYREKVDRNMTSYHLLCREPDGTWADRIIRKVGDAWEEMTAFEPKETKVWSVVREWLERKSATPVKNLPW